MILQWVSVATLTSTVLSLNYTQHNSEKGLVENKTSNPAPTLPEKKKKKKKS